MQRGTLAALDTRPESSLPVAQAENVIVKTHGEPREEDGLRNHVDLVLMLDIVDLEAGTVVAGAACTPACLAEPGSLLLFTHDKRMRATIMHLSSWQNQGCL